MYHVVLSKEARKDLKKIDKRFLPKVEQAIDGLIVNPYLGKALQGDFAGRFSLRVWPYRIIYKIFRNEITILVLAIKHRQGAYK